MFVSDLTELHIDKIHKDTKSFLVIPTLSSKYYTEFSKIDVFLDGGKKIDPTDSCAELYWIAKPVNQIARNVH